MFEYKISINSTFFFQHNFTIGAKFHIMSYLNKITPPYDFRITVITTCYNNKKKRIQKKMSRISTAH
jgi:hypothetical protein